MALVDLRTVPENLAPAAELLGRLDDAFETGFGRLSSANLEALTSLARSFAGTPLAALAPSEVPRWPRRPLPRR